MSCQNVCRLCDKLIISQSVTIVTVDGVDTLVIDLPSRAYNDNCKYCIIVAQTIPATATINQPVAFSIGGDTTTVYPFTKCDCTQIVACQIRTRTKYSTKVSTNATGGVFKALGNLPCCPSNSLLSLPVTTATTAPTNIVTPVEPVAVRSSTTKSTSTSKEVKSNG